MKDVQKKYRIMGWISTQLGTCTRLLTFVEMNRLERGTLGQTK